MFKHTAIVLVTLSASFTGTYAASEQAQAAEYAIPKFSWLLTGALSPRDGVEAQASDVAHLQIAAPISDVFVAKAKPAAALTDDVMSASQAAPAPIADVVTPDTGERRASKPGASLSLDTAMQQQGSPSAVETTGSIRPLPQDPRPLPIFESPFEHDGQIRGHQTQVMHVLMPAGCSIVSLTAGGSSVLALNAYDTTGRLLLEGVSCNDSYFGFLKLDRAQVLTLEVVNYGRYGNWYNLWTR